jgi:membrane-associated phospholipid phosphatase
MRPAFHDTEDYGFKVKLIAFLPLMTLLYFLLSLYPFVGQLGAYLGEPVALVSPLDKYIPFNFWFYLPYVLYMCFPALGFFLCLNKKINVKQIFSLYITYIVLLLLCFCIYLAFPTTAEPVMIMQHDPAIMSSTVFGIVQALYESSVPYGAFPSYHVVPMVVLSLFLIRHWRIAFWITLPYTLGASWGTVALKFHVIMDPIGGFMLGMIGYFLIYEKILPRYVEVAFKMQLFNSGYSFQDIIERKLKVPKSKKSALPKTRIFP